MDEKQVKKNIANVKYYNKYKEQIKEICRNNAKNKYKNDYEYRTYKIQKEKQKYYENSAIQFVRKLYL